MYCTSSYNLVNVLHLAYHLQCYIMLVQLCLILYGKWCGFKYIPTLVASSKIFLLHKSFRFDKLHFYSHHKKIDRSCISKSTMNMKQKKTCVMKDFWAKLRNAIPICTSYIMYCYVKNGCFSHSKWSVFYHTQCSMPLC